MIYGMPLNSTLQRVELTREELYEMVWSEAMTKVAARFQMSDVALKKRCIKHRIPMPGRGYWRKVETGTVPKRTALPKLGNAQTIIFDIQPSVMEAEGLSGVDQAFLDYEVAHPINVGPKADRPDAATQAITRDLKGRQPDEYGALRSRSPDTFEVRFHPSSKDRVIAIIDALAKACRDRGFTFRDGKEGSRYNGHLAIVADDIELRPLLEERMRRVPYRMTPQEEARHRRGSFVYMRTYSYEPTGELTLKLEGVHSSGFQTTWKDSRNQKIETRLNEVIIGLRVLANHQLQERRKAADRKHRYDLIQEKRAELRRQIAQEREAVEALEFDAKAWSRAQEIRAYIDAVERGCAGQQELEMRRSWITWARQQADRMDPLMVSPPSILDVPEQDYRPFEIWQMPNAD
jgi:hypothetical protein